LRKLRYAHGYDLWGSHLWEKERQLFFQTMPNAISLALIENHIDNGWAKHLDISLVFL
jgi:hypothetical protein